MKDLKMRRFVLALVPIAAVLALVLGLSSLSQGSASAQTAYPMNGPTATVSVTSSGGSCALYDSWCAYCSMSTSAACEAFVPSHTVGTTAAGAEDNSGNNPVMGVDAGCGCSSGGGGAYTALTSTSMTAMAFPAMGMYSFTPQGYSSSLDIGGSWTWCPTANMGGGAWVPSSLMGAALC